MTFRVSSFEFRVVAVALLLAGGAAPADAANCEDDNVSCAEVDFPFKKGVYNNLRVHHGVRLGSALPALAGSPVPRLHVIDVEEAAPALQIDRAPVAGAPQPAALLVNEQGRMSINGAPDPSFNTRLDVRGSADVTGDVRLGVHVTGTQRSGQVARDGVGELICRGCVESTDVDETVQLHIWQACGSGFAVRGINQDGSVICTEIQRAGQE